MLGRPSPPTPSIGGNNATTMGILAALRTAGLRVPSDVALVDFADTVRRLLPAAAGGKALEIWFRRLP